MKIRITIGAVLITVTSVILFWIIPYRVESHFKSISMSDRDEDASAIAQSIARFGRLGLNRIIGHLESNDSNERAVAAYVLLFYGKSVAKRAVPTMKKTLSLLNETSEDYLARCYLHTALAIAGDNSKKHGNWLKAIISDETRDLAERIIAIYCLGRIAKAGIDGESIVAFLESVAKKANSFIYTGNAANALIGAAAKRALKATDYYE